MTILGKTFPQLNKPYTIIQTSKFTTEGPGHIPGRRSRIGDLIVLIEGSKEFMRGLREFHEDHKFRLSGGLQIIIKGGVRLGQKHKGNQELELSDIFKSLIMQSTADETMEKKRQNAGQGE